MSAYRFHIGGIIKNVNGRLKENMNKGMIGVLIGVLYFSFNAINVGAGGNISAPKPYQLESNENLFTNQYRISEADIDLMAAIVFYEANTEDIRGKRLVVSVILNRVESDLFPNDIYSVISQKGQFTTYKYARNINDYDIPIDCYGAVLAELNERTDDSILFFSSEGYNGNISMYKYGHHYFSR